MSDGLWIPVFDTLLVETVGADMIPTGASVRPLPRRKGPRGVRQVEVSPGRWMDEAVAEAQGIPLVYPLPSNGSGPVTVRHAEPEVPMPEPAAVPSPPASGTGRPASENQERAWLAVTERGLYWPDVARELGTTSWAVKNMLASYMRRNGIPGEPPGRTPKEETTRRTMAAKGQTPKPSEAPVAHAAPEPPHVKADHLVLAPEGHPWAADPAPIDQTLAPPTSDQHLTPDPGHEMTAPVVKGGADHSQAMHLHASTGGEPGPVALPAKGTPAPHHPAPPLLEDLTSSDQAPRTGGGGRDVAGDDFLGRLERELDALAREDADLVARARELVEARTAVANRIERLRTAGEVYRAVMAGRAA